MPRFSTLVPAIFVALLPLGTAKPARAVWLHCTASGTGTNGPFAVYTTPANVGAVGKDRLARLQHLLETYVARTDPDARGTQATCFTYDDQLAAVPRYSRALNAAALRLGWEHISVLPPQAWLPDSDVVDDPSKP